MFRMEPLFVEPLTSIEVGSDRFNLARLSEISTSHLARSSYFVPTLLICLFPWYQHFHSPRQACIAVAHGEHRDFYFTALTLGLNCSSCRIALLMVSAAC